MTTKGTKTRSKKQICAEWASLYKGLHGNIILSPMPRLPSPGHAWDSEGQEARLVRAARRKLGERVADVLVPEQVADWHILTGEEHRDEE